MATSACCSNVLESSPWSGESATPIDALTSTCTSPSASGTSRSCRTRRGARHRAVDVTGFVEEKGELVAAEPCNGAPRVAEAREACADVSQQLVAEVVSESVVHLLEAVEVEQHHCQFLARSPRRDRVAQLLLESCAVGQ